MASKFGLKKKQKNKHQRHTQALLYPLLYVLPFFRSTIFDVTHDQPLKKMWQNLM